MGLTVSRIGFPFGSEYAPAARRVIIWPKLPYSIIETSSHYWATYAIDPSLPDANPMGMIEIMSSVAREYSLPSLVVHVLDSDCALLAGISATAEPAVVIFDEEIAEDYGEYADVLDHYETNTAALAQWAIDAGLPRLEQERLDELVAEDFDFAEEPVGRVGEILNLALLGEPQYPELDGLLQMQDAKTSIDGKLYKGDRARYAWGRGAWFWGVWDRKNPGPPLARFPDTHEGMLEARALYIQRMAELPDNERRL